MSVGQTESKPAHQHLRRNPPIAGEAAAIAAAQAGDEKAFEMLYALTSAASTRCVFACWAT